MVTAVLSNWNMFSKLVPGSSLTWLDWCLSGFKFSAQICCITGKLQEGYTLILPTVMLSVLQKEARKVSIWGHATSWVGRQH